MECQLLQQVGESDPMSRAGARAVCLPLGLAVYGDEGTEVKCWEGVPGFGNGAAVLPIPAAVRGSSVCSPCQAGNAPSAPSTGGWMCSDPREMLP